MTSISIRTPCSACAAAWCCLSKATDRKALPANLAARDSLPLPVWTATLDLTLPPA